MQLIRDVLSLDNRLVASCHDRRILDDNVDRHLSEEMQAFCTCQLRMNTEELNDDAADDRSARNCCSLLHKSDLAYEM